MSRTYSIGCTTCQEALWIGQDRYNGNQWIYTGEPIVMKALQKFLFSHFGHALTFVDDEFIFSGEGKRYSAEEYLAKGAHNEKSRESLGKGNLDC